MNIVQIKDKYKNILYSSSSECSADEEDPQSIKMQKKQYQNILVQSHLLNRSTITSKNAKQDILAIKQRLAQANAHIRKKDQQILQLKEKISRFEEIQKFKDHQIQELKRQLNRQDRNLINEKAERNLLFSNLKQNEQNISMQKLDNQLLQRQISFYKEQVEREKREKEKQGEKRQKIQAQLEKIKQFKIQNNRLKEDIKRLRQLLKETQKYKKLASKVQYRHYINKSSTQHQNWIPIDLLQTVSKFLSKFHSSKVDRKLQDSISRFIHKIVCELVKQEVKKPSMSYNSRRKQRERKHDHNWSQFSHSCEQSTLRQKSMKSKKNGESRFSRTITEMSPFSKPISQLNFCSKKEICLRIGKDLKQKISCELKSSEINLDRIMIILEWGLQSIFANLPWDTELQVQKTKQNKTLNTWNTTNIF